MYLSFPKVSSTECTKDFSRATSVMAVLYGTASIKQNWSIYNVFKHELKALFSPQNTKMTPQWLSTQDMLFFDKAVMTYKIIRGLCLDKLKNKFTQRSMVYAYRTRTRNYLDLQIPSARLEYTTRSFHFSATEVWNEIPVSIRTSIPLWASNKVSKISFWTNSYQTRPLGRTALLLGSIR